jgi:hypothetical protein
VCFGFIRALSEVIRDQDSDPPPANRIVVGGYGSPTPTEHIGEVGAFVAAVEDRGLAYAPTRNYGSGGIPRNHSGSLVAKLTRARFAEGQAFREASYMSFRVRALARASARLCTPSLR